MKLCKACKITPVVSNKFKYCFTCKKLKARNYHLKYSREHPEKHSKKGDGRISNFWVCDCPEGFIISKIFTKCFECGTYLYGLNRLEKNPQKNVFRPERDALDMNIFLQSYFERLNNGSTKPL